MKLSLRVIIEGQYWEGGACIDIPELMQREFQPLKTCDDLIIAYATGDVMEEEAKIIMKTREDAADFLAGKLARLIVAEMKKHDTHNGRPHQRTEVQTQCLD